MPAESPGADFTEDSALGGRLRLKQPRRGHRFGHDAVLLAASTGAAAGERVVELGSGVGLAGLALAARVPGVRLTLVEADAMLAQLALANAEANGVAGVNVVTLDVTAPARAFVAAGLPPGSAQRVLMNPPFNDPGRQRRSPDAARAAAHMAAPETLTAWTKAAARLLAPGGTLTLILRADCLADVLTALARAFGGITILPVHPRIGAPAIRILVRVTKDSRAPLSLLPGLALADADGRPTAEAEAILRHGAVTALAG